VAASPTTRKGSAVTKDNKSLIFSQAGAVIGFVKNPCKHPIR
jgi:hypothetical protein